MDRQDFFSMMSAAMAAPPGSELAGPLTAGRGKSRIIEAHASEPSPDGVAALVRAIMPPLGLEPKLVGDELWQLRSSEFVGFLDTLNPRFWQLHTTSSAEQMSRLGRQLVGGDTRLDSAWLPKDLLHRLDGEHKWLRSTFDSKAVAGGANGARHWRARFEGDAPEGLLDLLASRPEYAATATLTGLGSLIAEEGIGSAMVVADYKGLFHVGRGEFSVAASAIWNLLAEYEHWITALEERHHRTARALDVSGFRLTGDVALLDYGRRVEDVGAFANSLVTAKTPFRLWGLAEQQDDDLWAVDAVDLHVGEPLRLEVTPTRLRVLLHEHTCGNTIARLLTNLQQHLDARTRLLSRLQRAPA